MGCRQPGPPRRRTQFDYVALLNREGDYVYQDGLLASFPDWRRQDLLQPVLDQLQQQPEVQFIAYLPENGKLHWITGARVVHSEDSARTARTTVTLSLATPWRIPTSPA